MKNLFLLLTIYILSLTSCEDNIKQSSVHTYYIKNNSDQTVVFMGISQEDTLFNEKIISNEQFEFYKVYSGYSLDIQAKVEIDKSDSIFIYLKDSLYYKIANNPGQDAADFWDSNFLREAEEESSESHWVKDNKNDPDIDYVFIVE